MITIGDINEACQVVIIIGRMAYRTGNVLIQTALFSARTMSTIAHAKWRGKTSYKNLLRKKGEENGLLFLNIGLEPDSKKNRRKINAIKKELKEHGIMYAVMPDLCGGDGNTQIAISAIDAKKMEAMLYSHMHGKNKDIYIAEISEFDYTMTGRRLNGQPTQNMQDLQKNAMQNGFPHMPDYSKQPVAPSNQKAPVNSPTPSIQDKMTFQVIRQHDLLQSIGVDGFSWLKSGPLLSQEMNGQLYHLITMPDGVSGIIISDKEYREPILAKASGYENFGALICADKNYPLVDYKTGRIYNASGRQMIAQSRKMPIQDYEKKLEAMLQNQTQRKVLQESITKAARGRQI